MISPSASVADLKVVQPPASRRYKKYAMPKNTTENDGVAPEADSRNSGWVCSAAFCFAGKMPYGHAPIPKDMLIRNEMIDQQIERDRLAAKRVMKILLLGGPESGKSTLFKQMRILHMNGFSDLDMINYRYLVYSNIVQAVYQILEGAEHLKIPPDPEVAVSSQLFRITFTENDPFRQK